MYREHTHMHFLPLLDGLEAMTPQQQSTHPSPRVWLLTPPSNKENRAVGMTGSRTEAGNILDEAWETL